MDGETPCKDWRPVIAGMGASGWELTAIIQTPILVQSSFTTFTIKVLMLFQRAIYKSHQVANQYAMRCYRDSATVASRYSGHRFAQSAPTSNSLPKNLHLATGLKEDDDSYYNHTLKRYVRTQSSSGGAPVPPPIPPSSSGPDGASSETNVTQVRRTSNRRPIVRRMSRSASFTQEGQQLLQTLGDRVPPSPSISISSVDRPRPHFFLEESDI